MSHTAWLWNRFRSRSSPSVFVAGPAHAWPTLDLQSTSVGCATRDGELPRQVFIACGTGSAFDQEFAFWCSCFGSSCVGAVLGNLDASAASANQIPAQLVGHSKAMVGYQDVLLT